MNKINSFVMRSLKRLIVFYLLFWGISLSNCYGQQMTADKKEVYKINPKVELPISTALFGANFLGFEYLRNKPGFELEEVLLLEKTDVWRFDRFVIDQDVSFRDRAHDISDFFLNSSVLLPGLLALDKSIRDDWFNLLVLYAETHAINTGFYISVASVVKRPRPFNYNVDVPLEDKLAKETRNSFFSGHVSSAASASFFMAKVYSDYHTELGNKKYWLYGAAIIPPSLVGFYRIKAMKHFPSDVITGGIVGAAAGILIPHLHKIKKEESCFAFVPFSGNVSGLKVSYTFR